MTQEFRLESHLLGVRRFDLAAEVSGKEAASLLTLWVGQVLDEYGLEWSWIAGVTVDGRGGAWAGSDFDVCRGIPGVLLERCIPSGLDQAMREAFGLEGKVKGGVENKAARDVLEGVMKAVESMDMLEVTQVWEVFGCSIVDVVVPSVGSMCTFRKIALGKALNHYRGEIHRYLCKLQTYLSEIHNEGTHSRSIHGALPYGTTVMSLECTTALQ